MSAFRRRGSIPLLYGHRGASAHAPENTLRAFELALDSGADGVELDVRCARDQVVVVCHDPDLRRVAGRPERICALDASELSRIDVGGDTIPRLDDAIDLVVGRGALLNVEIKGDVPSRFALARAVGRLLRRRSARERELIVVSSFRPEMLAALRTMGARVAVAFLFDRENTGPLRAAVLRRALAPEGVHPQSQMASAAAIARWHRRGAFVNAWTVDDPGLARSLDEARVDGIITNDPKQLRDALRAPERAPVPG